MRAFKIIISIFLLTITVPTMAQGWMDNPPPGPPDEQGPRREMIEQRIKTIKVWKLTEDLNLTTEQSEKFFPVYNKFQDDREAIEQARRGTFDKLDELTTQENPSDKEINALLDKLDSYDKRLQERREQFRNELKDVLTIQQIGRLYVFEVKFMQEMRSIIRDAMHEKGFRGPK